jgi:hypothetical protein
MENAILILGNGFDKSLGLPTTYQDFINSTEFKELIAKGNFIAKYTVRFSSNKGWEGVEVDLIKIENYISGSIDSTSKRFIRSEILYLRDLKVLKILDVEFKEKYIELIDCLNNYLTRIESEISLDFNSIGYKVLDYVMSTYDTQIYTFNYTDAINKSLANVIQNVNKNYISTINNINFVHGSVEKKNIIFGVSDKSIENDDNSFLLKSQWRTYGISGLKTALSFASNVFIFGFSLGKTDHDYFKHLFNPNTSGKTFYIFYFDDESYQFFNKMLYIISGRYLADIKNNNKFVFIKSSEIEEEHKDYFVRNPKF